LTTQRTASLCEKYGEPDFIKLLFKENCIILWALSGLSQLDGDAGKNSNDHEKQQYELPERFL
jgi:hypothetical protein